MSAKMGRPTDNPKTYQIAIRLDKESREILEKYCEEKKIKKGEAIRRGIMLLVKDK